MQNTQYAIVFAPHPPMLLPEIGKGEEKRVQNTLDGMAQIAELVKSNQPDTLIFITPHGNTFNNGTCLLYEPWIEGDLQQFGEHSLAFKKQVDMELTEMICQLMDDKDLVNILMDQPLAKQYKVQVQLDHGVLVPIYFIDQHYQNYKIVHISPGFTALVDNYKIGMCIQEAIKKLNRNVMIVASGDLSHCLSDQGPYSFHPMGEQFDGIVRESIMEFKPRNLVMMDPAIYEPAGQCGLRSYTMAMGTYEGIQGKGVVFSYEGPFGVGYLTGSLLAIGATKESELNWIEERLHESYLDKASKEDDFIKLARRTINEYTRTGKRLQLEQVELELSKEFLEETLNKRSGSFVSIHKDGELRGCIGTILSTKATLFEEIVYNAIQAASSDPRFNPVETSELEALEIKVDVLHELEPISSENELDVQKYGVVVEHARKRGLLLPNLEGIDTVEDQIAIAKQKAGIKEGEKVQLYRFEVERHEVH